MKDLLPRVGSNPDAKVGSINPQNLFESGWGSNEDADEELRILMGVQKILDYPKPVSLLAKLICACRLKDEDIVLDFFSGSGTMAHAAMYLNSLEGRFCNFILVQLPEKCGDGTVAKSAGYQTICDIGEERIRRAGSKIAREIAEENKQLKLGEEPKQLPDIGFRVFRLDDSGIERPKDGQLLIDRRKPGRTDLDIVFEAMLKWGYELTYPVEETEFAGYQCYSVAAGDLICCMRPGLTTDAIEAIAATQPRRVLMMDSAIDDTTKLNALAIFKRVEERTQQKIELRTV
jgi:adenine-specific DNA-methyltransferase